MERWDYHGQGTMKYSDGMLYDGSGAIGPFDSYEGLWKDGEWDGHGILKWKNGAVYVGGFRDGKRHGKGKMRFANGDVYEGQWRGVGYRNPGTGYNTSCGLIRPSFMVRGSLPIEIMAIATTVSGTMAKSGQERLPGQKETVRCRRK